MKLSSAELFRRSMVLPLNANALKEIQSDQVADDSNFTIIGFADDDQFYRICKLGVFMEINKKCDSMIDDYESEEVRNGFDVMAEIFEEASNRKFIMEEDRCLVFRMRDMAVAANKLNMSIFFIF